MPYLGRCMTLSLTFGLFPAWRPRPAGQPGEGALAGDRGVTK
jgi:hypothetical protein